MLREIHSLLHFLVWCILMIPDFSVSKNIHCMDFNKNHCQNNSSNCTVKEAKCEGGNEYCLALFKENNRGNEMILQTCWQWMDNLKYCQAAKDKECVEVPSNSKKVENLHHCCCKGHLCNAKGKFIFVPHQNPPSPTYDPVDAPTRRTWPEMKISNHMQFRPGTVLYTAVVTLTPLVVLCFFIILFYWAYRRYNCCPRGRRKPGQEMLLGGSGGSGAVTDETSLLGPGAIGPDGYKPGTLIELCTLLEIRSRGRYGCVWLSNMTGSPYNKEDQIVREVAVKVFPPQDRQSWITEQEIYRLRGLQHPSILRYIGADQCGENVHAQLWIVTEYHPVGSVADFLRSNTMTWPQLLSIIRTMAEGMRHLHEEVIPHKPSIAHRDLKSKNVLLKSNLHEVCIADMGLALKFDVGQRVGDTHAQVGTRRYMAPEVLEGAIQFSRDSFLRIDMYAMALVMWEMMTRCNFMEIERRRSERSTSDGSGGIDGTTVKQSMISRPICDTEVEAAEDADDEDDAGEEADEGLVILDDASPRSTPSHSPGGSGGRVPEGPPGQRFVIATGAAPVYQLPFEAELGSQPSLEAMQDFVVQRKQRPKMNPEWRLHEGMQLLWDTLEECWDQDAEARLSAGLVVVRMESLESQLPATRDGRAANILVRHALHRQRHRRDSSSSALGSSASSIHPLVAPNIVSPSIQQQEALLPSGGDMMVV